MHIPFKTNVLILGPLIKQNNLWVQLQFPNFQFLLNAFNLTNDNVKTCIQSAMYNLSTLIEMRSGDNLANGFTLNEINQMIEFIATD